MSRMERRIKRKAKRKARAAIERSLIDRIDILVRPYGGRISGLGPHAVGVQGDARSYGITVVIRFPGSFDHAAALSTHITNHVREVTRVLLDVDTERVTADCASTVTLPVAPVITQRVLTSQS